MTHVTAPLPLPVLTVDSAPKQAHDLLVAAKTKFGFVPNLLGVMANAPALLEAYMTLGGLFDKTSLNATERQIVLLATSYENACEYCMAAHTGIATMQKVDAGVISALRDGTPIAQANLEALRAFAAEVARTRGWPSAEAVARFTGAGYAKAQALEVVLGVGMKTLSNYANHLVGTPLDSAFAPASWKAGKGNDCGCSA